MRSHVKLFPGGKDRQASVVPSKAQLGQDGSDSPLEANCRMRPERAQMHLERLDHRNNNPSSHWGLLLLQEPLELPVHLALIFRFRSRRTESQTEKCMRP